MTTISATSILASRHAQTDDRLDTLLLRYPRLIHAELMTHRVFSRNAASSRAIPTAKLIEDVEADPAEPLVWTRNEPGMQGRELLPAREAEAAREIWFDVMSSAVFYAKQLARMGAHKQIVNRLLEPFAHITVVVSSTQWSNFLALRDHPDAEPHMQMLAREVRKALDGATVQELHPGQWHLPFVSDAECAQHDNDDCIKLSIARCASTSYKTVDGFDMTLERATEIYDKLIGSEPLHASPCEHVAQADYVTAGRAYEHPQWHGNFRGFAQFRKLLPRECL